MLNVVFAGVFAASLEPEIRRRLKVPCNVLVGDEHVREADVLVTLAFTSEMGRAARRLKLVQVPGAGLDRIDRTALSAGVQLANVYGHETGIAEYVIGAMLSLTREFGRLDAAMRRGEWQSQWAVGIVPPPVWPELAGKTLGILGYGRIGQAIARRARAFDMRVQATRRDPARSRDDHFAGVGGPEMTEAVLRAADYLVVAMPASPDTIRSIGPTQLRLMKKSAVLINIARAEIIDEHGLYEALAARDIRGAVLDVWYKYPTEPGPCSPAQYPFRELPNVLMTPHIAGWTEGMIEARCDLIAENIHRVDAGQTPLNLITGT